ncbi:MAG TPA: ubiquitin-like domain-containing protein [Streptosporangiales bacterium]
MRKTPAAVAVGVAAFAVLVGGGVAYATANKEVKLTVDGAPQTVHTLSGNVSGVLDGAGIKTTDRDLVAPKPQSAVHDGDQIVVRHARQVTVTVDGKTVKRWVTALNVSEALRQLGIHGTDVRVSADRSTRIPLAGLSFSVRLPKSVTVTADHKSHKVVTFGSVVQNAVDDSGITLNKDDRVTPSGDSPLVNGMKIAVQRITVKRVTRTITLDMPVKKIHDSSMSAGTTKVEHSGSPGQKVVVYEIRTVDGKRQPSKKISEKVTRKPTTQVVRVGTKKDPPPTSRPAPVGTNDTSFWTLGGWDWKYLARCESGLNPRASNGTHFGLYQFSLSTWQSVGGSGDPRDASELEQTQRAYTLIKRAGPGQWTCPTRRV